MSRDRARDLFDRPDERVRDDCAVDLGDPDDPAPALQTAFDDLAERVLEAGTRVSDQAVLLGEFATEGSQRRYVGYRRAPEDWIRHPSDPTATPHQPPPGAPPVPCNSAESLLALLVERMRRVLAEPLEVVA